MKYFGLVLTAIFVALWLGSKWYGVTADFGPELTFQANDGSLQIGTRDPWDRWDSIDEPNHSGVWKRPVEWGAMEWGKYFRWFRVGHQTYGQYSVTAILIPLWSLVLLSGVPTIFMFRSDRKGKRMGHPTNAAYPELGNRAPAR